MLRRLALTVIGLAIAFGAARETLDPVDALAVSVPPAGSCHARGGHPDARCTPGARDRHVTQATIDSTICRKAGYSDSVRPPTSYTEPLKRRLLRSFGFYAGHGLSSYELDHLIPISLGGSPRSVQNLWPEAHSGAHGSFIKDRLEFQLYHDVCAHRVTLAAAQRAMVRWPSG